MTRILCLLLFATLCSGALAAVEDQPTPKGTPFLGVKLDLAASETVTDGVVVRHVYPGSTAAALGVLVGDVICAANGNDVRSREHLQAVVEKMPVGGELTLAIRRGEQKQELKGAMLRLPYQAPVVDEIRQAQQRIAKMEAEAGQRRQGDDDIGLAMSMQMLAAALNEFPEKLQAAAKEFKKVYPKGAFAIRIEIDIRTDAEAEDKDTTDLSPATTPNLKDIEKALVPEPEQTPAPRP